MAERWSKRHPRLRRLLVGAPLLIAVLWLAWLLVPVDQDIIDGTAPSSGSGYLDMHVHTAGLGLRGSGNFVNQAMRDSYKFDIYLRALDVTLEELEQQGDGVVLRKLSEKIASSRSVEAAVVLAMDGALDGDGQIDREATQLYVDNNFLAGQISRYDNLLFGASINPLRGDAIERLRRVKSQGAVLIKWIPNIMHFDPGDENLIPFYQEMVRLGLPLLSHAGQERSFAGANDAYGDPLRLELPLQQGVTVIAAHIATTGESEEQSNYLRLLPLFERYPNLYSEVSSLTQINKLGFLADAMGRSEIHDRLLYGTDWPLQFFPLVSPLYHYPHISLSEIKSIGRIDNQWDRDVELKRAMGVSEAIFERSKEVIGRKP